MKQKFLPCFQICYSQHRCIPARLPSSPLWAKDLEKNGKKVLHLIVRLVIRPVEELASTMENLSALLWICRLPWCAGRLAFFYTKHHYEPHLAPDDGDGLVSKGVADQGRVLLHYRCPIVGSNLRCGNVKRENAAESNLEVDRNLDVKENGFAHLTHSVLNLTPGEKFDNQSVGDCANSSANA